MADFRATTTVDATEDAVFDFLSQVQNLPRYFARMTSARPGDGDEVHTTAVLPDGSEVEGDAWFRVDEDAHSIAWGSEGPHDYHGSVEVGDAPDGSAVQVRLHTTRVAEGDPEIQADLDATLATVKQLVEDQHATR